MTRTFTVVDRITWGRTNFEILGSSTITTGAEIPTETALRLAQAATDVGTLERAARAAGYDLGAWGQKE